MISQLTPIQHIKVFEDVLGGEFGSDETGSITVNNLVLNKEKIKLFFDTSNFSSIKQNCNHFFWVKIHNMKGNTDIYNHQLKHFESYYNSNISKYLLNTIKLLKSRLFYIDEEKENKTLVEILISWFEDKVKHKSLLIPTFFDRRVLEENYNINTNNHILSLLYKQLEYYDFIEERKTSEADFINVLKNDWFSDKSSKIYLKMDHLQTKLLIDNVKEKLGIKIKLSDIEKAKNIWNKNGEIKASSLSSSKSKSFIPPKQSDLIINLIKKVKI